MPISWNEIRQNAIHFSREWCEERREEAEAKTFWDEFFGVFGIRRRTVASFEEPVRSIKGTYGFIDLFWPKMALAEHKSRGHSLDKAESQAFRYIQDLAREGRGDESPRYVILSDFGRIVLYDLEPDEQLGLPLFDAIRFTREEFALADFHKNIHLFAFIPGYKQHKFEDQDPINLKAVEILGRLHDTLYDGGYRGHDLERFLVRVLFCLFAEDTGLFERETFRLYLENRTKPDGSDLGPHLARLFEVLDTPVEGRQANLDDALAGFPHVNGALFAEHLRFADFNRAMRDALLASTRFDWSKISPAVFGSLFQSVMEPADRRQVGGHYTSERDILKIVRSLFLDDLAAELERIQDNKARLRAFLSKLRGLRLLDPACGCGNFLVIAYRELRRLELRALKALCGGQQEMDIRQMASVDVDQFFGIELMEWPARIAEVAMWLMDHQMNLELSEVFGEYVVRLPLRRSAHIAIINALRCDWSEILPPAACSYVLGNPPFVGAKFQTPEQRQDMALVARDLPNYGLLDYVTGWYFKAADYLRETPIRAAFVSTNSISQGEQVGVLWGELLRRGVRIRFAHRTFPWESEARGKAHVHVVIIGFGHGDANGRTLYSYHGDAVTATKARNISPYLVEGPNAVVVNRSKPLCDVPEIGIGNKPIDDGNYLFTPEEKADFLRLEPAAKPFFRPWMGAEEFINDHARWCLWLGDCPPEQLRRMPLAMERVQAVRAFRLASRSKPTNLLAQTPTRFHVENMPKGRFLVIPGVSSERRRYIPMGFLTPRYLASNLLNVVSKATLFDFGVLTSFMHMSWLRHIGGRLKSDYRYSAKLVYNNFPWPKDTSPKQKAAVEAAANDVLQVRKQYPNASLADLYDPHAMPGALLKAHTKLDRAVDRCYRSQPFSNDVDRMAYLFALYEAYTAPLSKPSPKRAKRGE